MTFATFVDTKFIPEHVEFKTVAGRRHYQAILKHLVAPELVNRMFGPESSVTARLRSAPDWPYLDGVRLCDLNSDHVRRLVAAANAADYSSQTVKHIKNVIFAIIAHAQREGCFEGPNPASLVKLGKVTPRKQHNLTLEQTKQLLRELKYPAREIALLAITTDMNLGEICGLEWKHVNLTGVDRFVDGEPLPALSIAVKAPVNEAGVGSTVSRKRNIGISEPLLSSLKELSRRPGCDAKDFVFLSDKGNPILPSSLRTSFWMQIGRQLEIPWLTWSALRRARSSFIGEVLLQLNPQKSSTSAFVRVYGGNPSDALTREPFRARERSNDVYERRTTCCGRRFVRK